MADCIDCGKKIGFLNRGDFDLCDMCSVIYSTKYRDQIAAEKQHAEEQAKKESVRL